MMAKYAADEFAAEARRWLTTHRGPETAVTRAVRKALAEHYDDIVVLDGIAAWKERQRTERRSR